jgi:hypothetical protein
MRLTAVLYTPLEDKAFTQPRTQGFLLVLTILVPEPFLRAFDRARVRRALDTRMGSHKRRSPGYEVSMTLLYSLLFPSAAFFVLFVSFPS